MKLPYVRSPEFLSPSSLRQFEQDPVGFYVQRCGPKENRVEEGQGFPAAVGSSFDAHVKRALAKDLKLKCPTLGDMLIEKIELKGSEGGAAIRMGKALLDGYISSGAYAKLLGEDVTALEPGEVIVDVGGVPVRGDLDAILDHDTPFDWKVVGSGSPGTRSPTQGYQNVWDTVASKNKGPHKRCGEPLDTLQPEWAAQLATYVLLLGGNGCYAVDEVVVRKGGRVSVAVHRGQFSMRFMASVVRRFRACWAAVQEERVVPRSIVGSGLRKF